MGNCFSGFIYLTINATTPPVVTSGTTLFGGDYYVKVPDSSLDAYRAADGWNTIAKQIFSMSDKAEYDVNVTAQEKTSGLSEAIGTDNLQKVLRLKVNGTINGYDIMVIRNKMDNLHYLDLSDAEIVDNDYEYYTGYSTKHNEIGDHAFDGLTKLFEIALPKDITRIGASAFVGCRGLTHISLPSKVKVIGSNAFYECSNLRSIEFSPVLEDIHGMAFGDCISLKNISLPGTLTHIRGCAFQSCFNLSEVRIPSSLQRIENQVFYNCSSLQDVYTYTVEPTHIDQTTFSTYATATLHVPEQSFKNYYWNTEWSQFRELKAFDEPYSYFYLNNEYTLASRFKGNPLIDLNPGGGLIVEGEDIQNANNINIMGSAGSDMGTLIANGNVNAEKLVFDIRLDANRWYFFCFPFDIKRSNVSLGTGINYVFRRYDGALRAANGSGGWTDLDPNDEWLHRGTGYIFQASKDGTLTLRVEKEQLGEYLEADNGEKDLATFAAPNSQNASWNFIGNPHTSYFDMNDMGFDAPVTYWDGSSYVAVRPGDDDHIFKPFEAFFVQKPAATASVEFDATKRLTQQGAEKQEEANRARRMAKGLNANRLFVNLTLTDDRHTDRTRVVYNADRKAEYEPECDAPKFAVASEVPQLYTVEHNNLLLAINERPMGSVQLGYVAPCAGDYTLSAVRMDQPMLLKDNLLGTTHDLTLGDYTFTTAEGTFNDRFQLLPNKEVTGVMDLKSQTGVSVIGTADGLYISGTDGKTVNVYNTRGQLMASRSSDGLLALSKGIYVAETDGMTCKVIVK